MLLGSLAKGHCEPVVEVRQPERPHRSLTRAAKGVRLNRPLALLHQTTPKLGGVLGGYLAHASWCLFGAQLQRLFGVVRHAERYIEAKSVKLGG